MVSHTTPVGLFALAVHLAFTVASPIEAAAPVTMPPSPRPTPTSTEIDLPYPYFFPTITLTTDSTGRPLASLSALSQYHCNARSAWLATVSSSIQVPCLGATQLSSYLQYGKCPLGGGGGPPQPATVQATQTRWSFVCSPTPDPHPTPRPTDFTTELPAPTLPPGFRPSYTPYLVQAAQMAEGWCYARVAVTMTDYEVATRECNQCLTCSSPTLNTATTTKTIGVDCKPFAGRCSYETMTHVGDWRRCPSVEVESQAPTVTAGVKTTWAYSCLPTGKT